MPMAARSSVLPVADTRPTHSTPTHRSIHRGSSLSTIYAHRSHKLEDPFRSSGGSCLERRIPLYFFKIFGNLLPKGEKCIDHRLQTRVSRSFSCWFLLPVATMSICFMLLGCFYACEILRSIVWLIILCLMCG